MVELSLCHRKGGILTAQVIATLLARAFGAGVCLLHIVEAIDGPILEPAPVDDGHGLELRGLWKAVAGSIGDAMRATTLRRMTDIVAPSDMYYI